MPRFITVWVARSGKVKRLDGKVDKAETTIEEMERQVKTLSEDKDSLNKTLGNLFRIWTNFTYDQI